MASPKYTSEQGMTISFATSAWTVSIRDVSLPSISLGHSEVTNTDAGGWAEFAGNAVKDPGELSFTIDFNPDDTKKPPQNGAAELITLTFPSGATWAMNGFITNEDISGGGKGGEVYETNIKIKLTGAIVRVDAP